jgi:hypothetical protein
MIEQHVFYVRLTTQAQRRAAIRIMHEIAADDESVYDDMAFDGWFKGFYWAARMMGERGRIRYPVGHAQAGTLITGHFFIIAFQGPLDKLPDQLKNVIIQPEQFNSIYPGFPPEVMG